MGVARGSSSRAQIGPADVFGVHRHRAELVDGERLAVEAHPLLPVEDGTGRAALDERGDDRRRNRADQHDARRKRDVDRALEDAVDAAQRHVVDADDRQAVQILEPGAERDELQQVRHDVDVDALAAGELHDAQHLHVLVDGQRDVDLVDLFLRGNLRDLVDGAEHRQAAVADRVGRRRAVVDEAREPEPHLAVLDDPVRDHPAEVAAAHDEDAPESDARAPAPPQQPAHDLPREEREHHVQTEEDHPGRLRDREVAEVALNRIDPVSRT